MKGIQSYLLFCLLIILIPAPEAISQSGSISYNIPFVEHGPAIDGTVNGVEWAGAERVYLENETDPSQNVPALVNTEVLMMEDGVNFYVAFIASDPEPEKIRVFFSDRDSCWDDDRVGIIIDTFNDERRAFQFFANPFGVQIDAVCDDITGFDDFSWNAIWDAAGEINDNGYVVEMKIPLDQLRFPSNIDKQTWGIDLVRYYPRNKRHRFSNNTKNYDLSCYLCQLKKAEGFERLSQELDLRIVPTLTLSYSESRPQPLTDRWRDDFKMDAGVDIRWGINQDSYLNATVNPDFSQVEADVAQLDVNNTFSLFFPEKREFFLEGADYFKTNMSIVYSRNISSPDYGIKLTGKRDVHTYGLFFTNDETTNINIPGKQGSFIASLGNVESRNTVARYRSAIDRNINMGVIFTDRRAKGYSNTVAGMDGNIRAGQSDMIKMQLMKSWTEYPALIQSYGQKAGMDDLAWLIDYSHDDMNWSWNARYADYGEDFRADMGFINRVDYRETDVSGGHTWRFGPESNLSRIFLGGGWEKNYDTEGNDLGEEFDISLNIDGPLQSFVFLVYRRGDELYNNIYFDKYSISLFGRIKPMAGVDISLDVNYGDSIDYLNSRSGTQLSINPWIDLQIGKHFFTSIKHNYQEMKVEGQKLYTSNLSDLRFTYQFTVRSFLRVTLQYSNIRRNGALYLFDIDKRSRDLTTQILYSYKINPQTRFFIGYSDTGYQDDDMNRIYKTNRTLFTKCSYAW
ncbi:MAG: carbohydrate binding family 9 domain-containing protein [Deltaproteobacteria bacterium]|nr:carbohydrate binding family 9 domain-containing protein [Deltaproteobacteria bacterium]